MPPDNTQYWLHPDSPTIRWVVPVDPGGPGGDLMEAPVAAIYGGCMDSGAVYMAMLTMSSGQSGNLPMLMFGQAPQPSGMRTAWLFGEAFLHISGPLLPLAELPTALEGDGHEQGAGNLVLERGSGVLFCDFRSDYFGFFPQPFGDPLTSDVGSRRVAEIVTDKEGDWLLTRRVFPSGTTGKTELSPLLGFHVFRDPAVGGDLPPEICSLAKYAFSHFAMAHEDFVMSGAKTVSSGFKQGARVWFGGHYAGPGYHLYDKPLDPKWQHWFEFTRNAAAWVEETTEPGAPEPHQELKIGWIGAKKPPAFIMDSTLEEELETADNKDETLVLASARNQIDGKFVLCTYKTFFKDLRVLAKNIAQESPPPPVGEPVSLDDSAMQEDGCGRMCLVKRNDKDDNNVIKYYLVAHFGNMGWWGVELK